MGQAKKRGTEEQRKAEAVLKEAEKKAQEVANLKPSAPLSRNAAQALLMAATFANQEKKPEEKKPEEKKPEETPKETIPVNIIVQ